jgi:PKD domain
VSQAGHKAPLVALLVLIAGCGSCQRSRESNGGAGAGSPAQELQPPTPALPHGAVAATPKRQIAFPTLAPRQEFPTPAAAPTLAPTEQALGEQQAPGDCIVIIDADPDFGEPPLTVNFSVESQCSSGTPSYKWDFGDGSPPSTETAPVHVYQKAGDYTVSLAAVAPDGTQAADDMDITVEESPVE